MLSPTKCSVQLQTNLCISSGCNHPSELICRHCHQSYCYLCFMCHRKNLLDDMQSIAKQMSNNREQGTVEVISFINQQAEDAREQAKQLIKDVIDRILKASENISRYIEQRRQVKLHRLEESLGKFDTDAYYLQSKLSREILLPAHIISQYRRTYAYNMFDTPASMTINPTNQTERFFDDYRYYHQMISLRQKWTFLQSALTTVYFPKKKNITLDQILTFLEYRHDRVLDNYREYLSKNEATKELSLKSTDDLLNELTFFSKPSLPHEIYNFSYIAEQSLSPSCNDSKQNETEQF